MQIMRIINFRSIMIVFLAMTAIVSSLSLAHAQNKFFATPNRGGVEGAKGSAQIGVLFDENRRENTCTAAGLIFAPTHPKADASGCTSAAGQRDLTGGLTVGANAQVSGSLSVGGGLSINGPVNFPSGVGIGVSPAVTALDVSGAIKVAGEAEVCDANRAGALRYNTGLQQIEFCNGIAWGGLGAGASAILYGGSFERWGYNGGAQVNCSKSNSATGTCACPSGYTERMAYLSWHDCGGACYTSLWMCEATGTAGGGGSSGGSGGSSIPTPPTCSGAGYALQWDGVGWLCDGETLIGGKATSQCASSGGSVFDTGSGKICRFNQSSCPSGWSSYQNFSATTPRDTTGGFCYHNPSTTAPTGCVTGSHSFANTAIETCSQFNPCSGCGCSGSLSSAIIVARGCI